MHLSGPLSDACPGSMFDPRRPEILPLQPQEFETMLMNAYRCSRQIASTVGAAIVAALVATLGSGCAAITNPVADGIPVRRLPEEIRGTPREEMKPIPLSLLRQKPPDVYRTEPGDVLGILIENVLGDRTQAPPVRLSGADNQSPAIGYPIVVEENGKITLPYVPPILVKGKTLAEVHEAIRKAYVESKQILKPETERIIVSLLQPRRYHVLVMREDGGTAGVSVSQQFNQLGGGALLGASRKGTGFPLELPAGENDVLTALARSGGLPGTDAKNEIKIYRHPNLQTGAPERTILIPLRMRPGATLPIRPEDIILENGDIVYLEARETEVFYTAGVCGSGQYPLPRDYDLDILQAVAAIKGPLVNGGYSQNAFVATAVNSGLGNPSPSLVTVLRKVPGNRQIPIRVDLNLALRDPRERIIVKPGDIVVMQEKPSEGLARYFSSVFKLNLFGTIISQADLTGTTTLNVP